MIEAGHSARGGLAGPRRAFDPVLFWGWLGTEDRAGKGEWT